MYININSDLTVLTVRDFLLTFIVSTNTILEVLKLLTLVNHNNVLEFNHTQYYQIRDLTMRVFCAFTVTNLFTAWHEAVFAPCTLLYVRYIDDIFIILNQSIFSALLLLLKWLILSELSITWDVFSLHTKFLNLNVQFNSSFWTFQYQLHFKKLNAYHYILWTFTHSLSVKKVMFMRELCCMTVSSSE